MLNVERLTDDYLPSLRSKPLVVQRPLQAMLRILFHEKELSRFQASYPHLKGFDFVCASGLSKVACQSTLGGCGAKFRWGDLSRLIRAVS